MDENNKASPTQPVGANTDSNSAGASMPPPAPPMDPQEIAQGKTLAILGYIIGILCIIPLIQKDNEFALYHAKQVLLLIIAGVAISFVNIIPCLGQIAFFVAGAALFVFDIIGLINAINGRAKPLPLIGKLAEEWFKGIQKTA